MSIHVHELKSLKLYNSKNKLIIPLSKEDNKKGSVVYLLTPNIESSVKMMTSESVINRNWFKSYYLEKSITTILTTENYIERIQEDTDEFIDKISMMLFEDKLPSKERNELNKNQFGIPDQRKYPLNDEEHVRAAIRMFNHVSKEDEETLAKNIIKKLNQFDITDIDVGEDNKFYKYYHSLKEDKFTYKDYVSYSFINKDKIKSEYKQCEELYLQETAEYLNINIRNIVYLGKVYDSIINDDYNELNGFITAETNLTNPETLICKVFVRDINDDTNKNIIESLILKMRGVMINSNKFNYASIKYIGSNDYIMKDVSIKLSIILKNLFKKYSITGKNSYNPIIIPLTEVSHENYKLNEVMSDEIKLTNEGLRGKDSLIIFDDYFNEDNKSILKKILYPERIKNQKDILNIYNIIKTQSKNIMYTRLDIKAYKGLNLFVDTSYYNKAFFNNNTFIRDKGLNLYIDFLNRVIDVNKFKDAGYIRQTIFVPVMDWYTDNKNIMDYSKSINPISTIIRTLRMNNMNSFGELKNLDFIFFGTNGYFKLEMNTFEKKFLSKFISNINNLILNSPIEDDSLIKDTPDAITTEIIDKLEKSQNIKLYAVGNTSKVINASKNKDSIQSDITKPLSRIKDDISSEKIPADTKDVDINKKIIEDKKKIVVADIKSVASNSVSTEDALDKLDSEYVANIIKDIASEESNGIKTSVARQSRIMKMNQDFKEKTVKGKYVKDLINNSQNIGDKEPLPVTAVAVNSINNDQWENLQYINFNKTYDVDEDIMNILNFFGTRTVPVSIRNVDVEDTSTSEDLVETWSVQCEDINGTRFQLKFDIPKFKNNRFMRLRGNDKTINGQLMNLPILKTEKDVCQITTNYNKIFFRIFGSALGKSNIVTDLLVKSLNKYTGKDITYKIGSNKMSALKYDLPLDYIDIGNNYSTITYKDFTFYFNQDEIRAKYEKDIDLNKGIPIGYNKSKSEIIYYRTDDNRFLSEMILIQLLQDKEFEEIFDTIKPSVKYSYSKASIMSTTIPVIVICAYCEGLTKTLDKAIIHYNITDKKPKFNSKDRMYNDCIKFKDGFLTYQVNYSSSLLMNGLKECNTEDYSIKDIDSKSMWTEMLDLFGGRIKADGIDNFYDLMFDPITIRTCEAYEIPSDFCSALIYSSDLLADSKFNKHVDITGNRFRTNELVAGYTYKELAKSYANYRTKLKKTGKSTMSIKQSAVIDAILIDNTSSDASTINDLCYAEAANTVSFKGLSGMNSERSYSLDKRTYDQSMNGILAMSTGFAGTVGENRQTTINMNIQGKRGYIKDTANNTDIMNDVNTLSIAEAITPLSTTHDDPFREAMSFTQRTKHDMRVAGGDPLLITNGMDDALSNFTPDYFSVNAKQDGKIMEKTNEHIVIKYKDGSIEYVDLTNKVYKNSDGGFYTAIKLKPADKLGTIVKAGQLIAYDPLSYTPDIGYDNNATYNQGTLAKVAILVTDEGFEDSCVVDRYLSNALSSNVIMQVSHDIPKNTNVYNLVKVGQKIEEGEPLMVIQNAFEDDDVNILLKNLVDDADEVTSLGRIPIRSHNTGVIEDIQIYRTVEIEELSPSLQKIVKEYERSKSRIKNTVAKYDPDKAKEYVNDYKLNTTGKLKNLDEGVRIEIYVSYKDDFSVGDKLIILGAQKGVAKEVFDIGNEPTSEYRPEEPIDAMFSMRSFDARMITAPLLYALGGKFIVELDRQVKDIMGIKQDYTIHHKDLEPDKK